MAKPQQSEIAQFLKQFNTNLQAGNTDSLLNDFEVSQKQVTLKRLISVLSNKTGLKGSLSPIFKLTLEVDKSQIRILNNEIAEVSIPVIFNSDGKDPKASALKFKIRKVSAHVYKIVQVDTVKFASDYIAYQNVITGRDRDWTMVYSDITLASFKVAAQLKGKYDSVLYFDHLGNKTYYYVAKGKFESYDQAGKLKDSDSYKIGLVNPDLKEVIPVEYDAIHNISGTIDGLIEVEKDHKRGLFDPNGKIVLAVKYDQIFPLNKDTGNVALLRVDKDYFYLKKDLAVSDKINDFKIGDVVSKIKNLNGPFTLSQKSSEDIMEYNSKDENSAALILSPSYLVDLQILPKVIDLRNPLRHYMYKGKIGDIEDGTISLNVTYNGAKKDDNNWFESAFYSVFNHFIDGRSGLYESDKSNRLLIVDKKNNQLLGFETRNYLMGDGDSAETTDTKRSVCNENYLRQLNDTLFEFRTSSAPGQRISDQQILMEGPSYHYLYIKNSKLTALPESRIFDCTKYIKMDDSYLNGCFVIDDKNVDHMTPEILRYMKNEIYASYKYKFKNDMWNKAFQDSFDRYTLPLRESVDDSLTTIDKYNLNWINQKLKAQKPNTLAAK